MFGGRAGRVFAAGDPLGLILIVMPRHFSRAVKSREAYCTPRVGMMHQAWRCLDFGTPLKEPHLRRLSPGWPREPRSSRRTDRLNHPDWTSIPRVIGWLVACVSVAGTIDYRLKPAAA
jgi:hypothetical protein